MEQEFDNGIPARLDFAPGLTFPYDDDLDESDWKEEWREVFAENMPDWLNESVALDDIQYIIFHGISGDLFGGELGFIISGDFVYDDVRETLEAHGLEPGEYRKFETWSYEGTGDDGVALLEDRGLIVSVSELVRPFLKAIDRGEGFVDDSSELKQALDKAGPTLSILGRPHCGAPYFFFHTPVRSCEAHINIVRGGDAYSTQVAGIYVFRRESSAETGVDDIEDSIEDQDTYDADLEQIEAEGVFVTYEATIHEE